MMSHAAQFLSEAKPVMICADRADRAGMREVNAIRIRPAPIGASFVSSRLVPCGDRDQQQGRP
jgi:hypothetical protein